MVVGTIRLFFAETEAALTADRFGDFNVRAMRKSRDRAPVLGADHAQERTERNPLRPAVFGGPLHV